MASSADADWVLLGICPQTRNTQPLSKRRATTLARYLPVW